MKLAIILGLLFFVFAEGISAQQVALRDKYIEVPANYGAIFIMNQPESPLVFDEIQFLIRADNSLPQIRFVVRNKTPKKVTSFSVAFRRRAYIPAWASYGIGWEHTVGNKSERTEIIPPGGTYENFKRKDFELAPMNTKIAEMLGAKDGRSQVKIVWLGMVKQVVFEDGSVYDTGTLSNELFDFAFYDES